MADVIYTSVTAAGAAESTFDVRIVVMYLHPLLLLLCFLPVPPRHVRTNCRHAFDRFFFSFHFPSARNRRQRRLSYHYYGSRHEQRDVVHDRNCTHGGSRRWYRASNTRAASNAAHNENVRNKKINKYSKTRTNHRLNGRGGRHQV